MKDAAPGIAHVAFIGFGEAATAILSGWGSGRPRRVTAYDRKTDVPAMRAEMEARYVAYAADGRVEIGAALSGAQAVFSVVTADQALQAAHAASQRIAAGTLWLDCNSCAPDTKRQAAEVIEGAGGRYVDVAVMAPVHPRKHQVPLLVSGPHSEDAAALLRALDMRPAIAGPEVGQASAIKMIRSVMIKGMEALTAECFLAARRAGVDEQVIASLDASDPGMHWHSRGAYNLERMMVHGARRAAEMREVVVTLEALGLPGRLSLATADWQEQIAATQMEAGADDLVARADRLLARM